MTLHLRRSGRWAVLAWLMLVLPPGRHALESSMTTQMLLQLPLLIGIGWLSAQALGTRWRTHVDHWNHLGISGLVLASVTAAVWMLPRALDASVTEPWATTAKYLSLPLLVGLPFALSWPRMNFIVRGFFLLEFIATFFRLGWLYMISPQRLCSLYLLDDQQRLGQTMLVIGATLFVGVAGLLVWGRFEAPAQTGSVLPPPPKG